MLVGWRIAAPEFAQASEDILSGEGARLYGGPWNIPGTAAVYLGDSLALAALELLVRLMNREVLETFRKVLVYIPDEDGILTCVEASNLSPGWRTAPPTETRSIGDAWFESRLSPVLRVPSAVISVETNFVVNPLHQDIGALSTGQITDFHFDSRLTRG